MIKLITTVLQVYVANLKWKQRIYLYQIEDEIDNLAADGSPAAKLRIERLAKRLQFERERTLRPADGDVD